jgi:hypothetical protein
MHRYLVVELKKGDFQPEYIGKLNFYCSAVDEFFAGKVIINDWFASLSEQRSHHG